MWLGVEGQDKTSSIFRRSNAATNNTKQAQLATAYLRQGESGPDPDSAVDCSIALKFGTEFDHGTACTLQMFKVKGQRSRSGG